ncbi:MAG: TonB-dependent receptor, partial [Saprospiraceae bacterium]|nr:TonB-dependent receptor [Saprospiraceae bacterium]
RILLAKDAMRLEEIIVAAEKSSTEFKLDKRVFNVGKDLSSTGASALEVLNNVPSVNVSIEGEVTLRGSGGVQMLINGKPSVLANDESNALGSITADMIESIEVITNPSAKYEAEGSSGIINIVLKKNEKKGLNGSMSVNTGTPDNHSFGLSMNNRTRNFNLFTQLGIGYRELPSEKENTNTNLNSGLSIISKGTEYRNETFYNLVLGTDYYINPMNVITLSGSATYEVEDQPSETNFLESMPISSFVSSWKREETTEATNPKIQYELQYKRDFRDNKDHQLLFSAIGRYFGKDQSSVFSESLITGDAELSNQKTKTSFEEGKYTFNLDYTRPFKSDWTIETGTQYVANNVSNDFEVSNEENGDYVIDEGLTNVFDYEQNVLGIYGTSAYEKSNWGIKLGMRIENTQLNTLLQNTGQKNDRNFTDLFPSFHSSYKLTERTSFQLGYSRRIYRPRLWDLNPFFNIRNNYSVRAGNPDLQPEYTDSYEVGSIFVLPAISFNVNAFYRITKDVIERVSVIEDNINVYTPLNLGESHNAGLEINFKYAPFSKVSFNGDAFWNYFSRDGQFNDQSFDFSSDQWSGKMTTKVKVNRELEFEMTGQYQSDVETVQGTNSGNLFADIGIRYKIMNGKGVFNFSVRDLFRSRFRENESEFNEFYAYSYSTRGRFITFGFSYGFGKGEAMQYSGNRRR